MIIKADAAQLEWRVKAFLAQDQVAIQEILDPTRDIHAENQKELVLPGRTVSKNFLFRAIFADAFGEQGFRGPAYAFANDPNFAETSKSVAFWEKVIERFFSKYEGVYQHSISLIRTGCETGKIVSPSGRVYKYKTYTKWNGDQEWPRTQMLNHIVQGFSAELMIFARRYTYQNWNNDWGVLVNTVHDDIEADVHNDPETIYRSCCLMEDAFLSIPKQVKQWFNVVLNVPIIAECKYGPNLCEDSMTKFNREAFNGK